MILLSFLKPARFPIWCIKWKLVKRWNNEKDKKLDPDFSDSIITLAARNMLKTFNYIFENNINLKIQT